jgi:L-2-hydroxycarboxylate dehydrogenase (NAD+)
MNIPPEDAVRVPHDQLRDFVQRVGEASGLPPERADQLAGLLTDSDLRGVVSHGTVQIATYARLLQQGVLNPAPVPCVVTETSASLLVDGDGGLGYFPALDGTRRLVEKVEESGIGVLLTRHHGHVGAAGLYARLPLERDMIAFVTSGVQLDLAPGDPVYHAAGGSPMAFSAPTLHEDPMVLDFGTMHDLYDDSPFRDEIARKAPGVVLRAIGMGAVCQSWGGLLAGVPVDEARAVRAYPGANQGSMVIALKISLFADPEVFKQEMDTYVRTVRGLSPLPGFDRAYLPGGVEAAREREYRRDGVPLGLQHREALEALAAELELEVPWRAA